MTTQRHQNGHRGAVGRNADGNEQGQGEALVATETTGPQQQKVECQDAKSRENVGEKN